MACNWHLSVTFGTLRTQTRADSLNITMLVEGGNVVQRQAARQDSKYYNYACSIIWHHVLAPVFLYITTFVVSSGFSHDDRLEKVYSIHLTLTIDFVALHPHSQAIEYIVYSSLNVSASIPLSSP